MNADSSKERSVLTINAGSSSVRLAYFSLESSLSRLAELRISTAEAGDGSVLTDFINAHACPRPDLIVHRVVHGGPTLSEPCLIDAAVEAEIHRLQSLAPLHNRLALDWIRAAREVFGTEIKQASCFDTGFYHQLPAVATHYALPRELCEQHQIRRYGFHGLAHQSMLNQWLDQKQTCDDRRVISLQLGAGCSITACDRGRPIDTSMGFSPLEGLVMATRCGDLDPAIVLYLIEEGGLSAAHLNGILNESSGLRGVSRQSGDMRELLDSDTADAELAVAMFCHRARKYIGAYLAILGGANAILFGGGIGESAPIIRARILENMDWAGIRLDKQKNHSIASTDGGSIHAADSKSEIWVVPADEESVMANAAQTLLLNLNDRADHKTVENLP